MHPASDISQPAIPPQLREDFLRQTVSLRALELRVVRLAQKEGFRSAVGSRSSRQAIILHWHGADGISGTAECSGRPDPYYNEEFLDGSIRLLRSFIAPRLGRSMSIRSLQHKLAGIRGWRFTKAAVIDSAIDMLRRGGVPDLLDRWQGPRLRQVPVGISLGLYSDAARAVERVERAVARGYRRIKLKLSPAADMDVVSRALEASGDTQRSMDANGSFEDDGMEMLADLADNRLAMLEQPFAPDRLDLHAALRSRLQHARLCLDESVATYGQLISAGQLGSLDELNLKPGRVGGQLRALRILEHCRSQRIGCWVGGMFETGIGRLANLRHAALLPDAPAHDLSPSARYFHEDLVVNPLEMDGNGLIDIGDAAPVELDNEVLQRLSEHREMLEPGDDA